MYKRILIVVDPRPVARAAIAEGVAMARAHGAEALFFTVLPRYSVPVTDAPPFVLESPQEFQQAAKANADRMLAAAEVQAGRSGLKSSVAVGSGEDEARCIVEEARKRRCDLIVVASEGRNALLRLLLGSVIPGLITTSPVPVLVCKQRTRSKAEAEDEVAPPKAKRAAKPPKVTPAATRRATAPASPRRATAKPAAKAPAVKRRAPREGSKTG